MEELTYPDDILVRAFTQTPLSFQLTEALAAALRAEVVVLINVPDSWDNSVQIQSGL